ncbi:MAG TPA: GntG family PLP-dependent aldolase [Chitinophagaceae bacterium]|nr:GntG family PLP-dependent aldolase [Chitinophagaceae bacterium]
MIIDYRSDTVTKPSPAMLEAMMKADVGDDVFSEDPTINELEKMIANMFGMEAAIFCPSGTMTNQIAIKVHTKPAEEVICDKLSHIYRYEGGGIAFNSGCQVKLIEGERGLITAADVEASISPDDIHSCRTSLVSLENTSNRGGGSCYNFAEIQLIKKICLKNNLKLHLDGARLFNALVAKNESPQQYGEIFDSISICLSKSLGCPVGSLLLGKTSFIKEAKRVRKVLGGGMRQAGYLAAAGIYALTHNINRLVDDHKNAQLVAQALAKKSFVGQILPVETNILIFEVKANYAAKALAEKLKSEGILVFAISPTQIRMVFHLDITANMIDKTLELINKLN